MKPGERSASLPQRWIGYFDDTLGSDPVRQDRPHHGLDLSILSGAILNSEANFERIPCAISPARRRQHRQAAGPPSAMGERRSYFNCSRRSDRMA
jgi:hypothetical protein